MCATAGASLSLQHILSILTRPETTTCHVYFQDPTYFLAFNVFLDVGYKREQFIGISEQDDSGLNLDILQDYLIKNQKGIDNEFFNSVLYCVPTHANPTGSILSSEKRKKLVQLARQYNMLVICDDVYDILTFQGEVPKRVVAYDLESDGKHVVISNGSFSKILAPGARAGWIEAGDTIIKQLGAWYVIRVFKKGINFTHMLSFHIVDHLYQVGHLLTCVRKSSDNPYFPFNLSSFTPKNNIKTDIL